MGSTQTLYRLLSIRINRKLGKYVLLCHELLDFYVISFTIYEVLQLFKKKFFSYVYSKIFRVIFHRPYFVKQLFLLLLIYFLRDLQSMSIYLTK